MLANRGPHGIIRTMKVLTAAERAAAYGIDLSLLRANFERTPEERIRVHEDAFALAEALRRAGEASRARHGKTATEAE